jgi:hypothetical protein
MSNGSQETVADVVASIMVGTVGGVVLLGAVVVNAILDRRRQDELADQEVARLLLEDYLNREPGVKLGDSGVSFRYEDAVSPADEEEDDSFLSRLYGRS